MEKLAHAACPAWLRRWARLCVAALLFGGLCAALPPARATSLSAQELQIIGRAASFLLPPPGDGTVAIVYRDGDAASRQDAGAIAAALSGGLAAGSARLRPRLVASTAFTGGDAALVIAADGASDANLAAALRTAHLLCVTGDLDAVRQGLCTMGITTQPRVEIWLNHATAAMDGIDFAVAFRMMIREM